MKKLNFLILLLGLMLTSCATIVSGSKQEVFFKSTPSSAKVFIDEVEIGQTPIKYKLERKRSHHVMLKLDGYQTYETTLEKKFNAWFIGNIAFGGIIGLIVDPITGAMYKLTPKEINAQMAQGTVFKTDKNNIYIAVSLNIDPNWEKIGNLAKSE